MLVFLCSRTPYVFVLLYPHTFVILLFLCLSVSQQSLTAELASLYDKESGRTLGVRV